MEQLILDIDIADCQVDAPNEAWIAALEAGKVLYFPRLAFRLTTAEARFLTPGVLDPKSRNISLDANGRLKGASGDATAQGELAAMIGRFRNHAQTLVHSLLPRYASALRMAPTSYRPL